jgi:hypothetical protein
MSIYRTSFKIGQKYWIPAIRKDLLWMSGAKLLLDLAEESLVHKFVSIEFFVGVGMAQSV